MFSVRRKRQDRISGLDQFTPVKQSFDTTKNLRGHRLCRAEVFAKTRLVGLEFNMRNRTLHWLEKALDAIIFATII